jgi:hypothetical protein
VPEPEPEPGADEDAAVDTNAPPDAADEAEPAGEPADDVAGDEGDEAVAEAAVDEDSAEEGGASEAAVDEDAVAEDGATGDEDAETETEGFVVPDDEPLIKTRARSVLLDVRTIERCYRTATNTAAAATQAAEAALALADAEAVTATNTFLQTQVASLETLAGTARDARGRAEKALTRVGEIRAAFVEKQEELARIEAEEARQRAEEEARQRAEAEKQREIEREIARAESAHGELQPFIRKNDFQSALNAAKRGLHEYRTDEGKAAIQVVVDRMTYLVGLKQHVIERLNKEPFRWGWGRGPTATDVTGASLLGVRVLGKTIPWEEVGPAQMLTFIRKYTVGRDLTLRTLAEQNMAAAIYCFENGGTDAARLFAKKSIEYRPRMKEEAARLLPLDEQQDEEEDAF